MYQMSQITSFEVFYPYVLGYMIAICPLWSGKFDFISPTSDTAKEFSSIRVFGTVGLILAGMAICISFSGTVKKLCSCNEKHLLRQQLHRLFWVFLVLPFSKHHRHTKRKCSGNKILGLDASSLRKNATF